MVVEGMKVASGIELHEENFVGPVFEHRGSILNENPTPGHP